MFVEKLDRLLAAYHGRGWYPELRPGATKLELDDLEEALALPLPVELRSLWSWRNGHVTPRPQQPHSLLLRENSFIGTPEVLEERTEVMRYQTEGEEWHRKTFDMNKCIPFAADGARLTTVSCGPQGDAPHIPNSVVVLYGEIFTAYESIEKMIDTHIQVMETWDGTHSAAMQAQERQITQKHNPSIPISRDEP